MERLAEHYSRQNMVSEEALNAIECLPVLEELNCEPLDCLKKLWVRLHLEKHPVRTLSHLKS